MSCACENKKKSQEYVRMAKLAKATAVLRGEITSLWLRSDGCYEIHPLGYNGNGKLIEYFSEK